MTARLVRRRVPMLVAGLLLAAGCGGEEPVPPVGSVGSLFVGGGGEDGAQGFVEFADGQDVTLIPGSQGGFHVFVHVRVEEAVMDAASTKLTLDRKARRDTTGELVSQSKHRATFIHSTVDGLLETEKAIPMFLCPSPIGIPVADETLVVRVRALGEEEEEEEAKAEGALRLVPRCPTDDQAEFCRRICSG